MIFRVVMCYMYYSYDIWMTYNDPLLWRQTVFFRLSPGEWIVMKFSQVLYIHNILSEVVCMNTCMCIYTYMYTDMYTYVYIYMCVTCIVLCQKIYRQGYVDFMYIYISYVCLRANTPFRPHPSCLGKINKGIRESHNFTFILHSLKIFNKSLILPPPLNFYIHWRPSIRV